MTVTDGIATGNGFLEKQQASASWCPGTQLPLLRGLLQAFEALGTQIEEHVELVQVGPAAYRVHFEGGSHLDLLNEVGDMQRQLDAAEPGAGGHCIARTHERYPVAACPCQTAQAAPAERDVS